MSELTEKLAGLLENDDKNYDPRMEELMRSDRLIDFKYENLSVLEDQEIFHVAKIRGMQNLIRIPVWRIQKIYLQKDMLDYHAPWMDYIRSLDETNPRDKKELEATIGELMGINEMIRQLIMLRPALEGKRAILYADSIKPQVANNPVYQTQPQDNQEGFLSKVAGFIFGKKDDDSRGYQKKRY